MLSDRSWNTTKQSEYSQLEAKVTGHNNDKTALIAGLTTGIVVICMIITTFGLFVLYHHRHRTKKQQQQEEQMDFVMEPITPVTAAHLPPEQYDPFIIGAQALQIPHLDEPFTRRSVEVQPTFINQLPQTFERSSSVKITKYDNQPTRLKSIKPKLVRINTVLKKDEDGQTKKTCIKTTPDATTTTSNTSGTIDFYLCPPPPPTTTTATCSNNSSNSSLADGSITVFWEQQPSSS